MRKRFQWYFPTKCPMDIYIITAVISGFVISTATMTDVCNRCLNNSTCRIITNVQSNVSTTHCACVQGWLGERCQVRVRLLLMSVTMTTVTLKWEAMTSNSHTSYLEGIGVSSLQIVPNLTYSQESVSANLDKGISSSENPDANSRLTRFEFYVNYWTDRRRNECNIVPNLTKTIFTISGLDKGTPYTFCAKTDRSYTCDFDLVSHFANVVSACVSVTTKADDKVIPTAFLVVTLCIAVIGLVVLIIVVIISKRNNYFNILICAKHDKNKCQNGGAVRTASGLAALQEESRQDVYLLTAPKTNQMISFDLPNRPGKPKYKIKKRLRGYASFSAQNEQTIPLSTVLEYSERDLDEDEGDSDVDSDTETENTSDKERNDDEIFDSL